MTRQLVTGLDVRKVVDRVRRTIDLANAELSDEFFPAHLSIALIDTVFNPQLRYYKQVVPIINRYCQRFGLRRLRKDRSNLPPVEEQETLSDLINHYDELGPCAMQDEVFRARYCSPGTKIRKSLNVRRAAVALRDTGIETLQNAEDAALRRPEVIKCVLRPLSGISERTIRMFLMYSGNDDFVKGDVHVNQFVADALDRRVAAEEAERLVEASARELGVAPRLLDYQIWKLMYETG